MVAFVFLDPLMKYVGRTGPQENPVVVETKYGPLTEGDLAGIRQSRELVENFLRLVSIETVQTQVKKGLMDVRMLDRGIEQWFGSWQQELMGRSKPSPEESALETLLLSKRASQMGMVVSDQAINDLLKQITADSLTSEDLQSVIGRLQVGRRVSLARLFDAIRTEMLASKYSQLFRLSLGDVPPAQRFEYYARLNRRATAEVMPLAVADFIAQVPDPKDGDLEPFYEEHKNEYPDPASPEPGFKQPKRAAFQYFKADFAKFKEKFKPEVTDAEISEYYEKNKAQFRAAELPADSAEEAKPDDAAPSEEKKPGESGEETSTEPAPNAPAPDTKPNEPAPTEPKPGEPPAAEPKNAFSLPNSSTEAPIRLVSATADDEKPAETTPAAPPVADADAKPATDEPAAESTDKPTETAEPAETAADDKPAADKPEEPKYEPLEKVKDTIRDSIAGQKAAKQISEIFEELLADMKRYADELDVYSAQKGSNPGATQPKPFPFAELATAKGVEAKKLLLVTATEAAAEDIGHVSRTIPDRRMQFGFRIEPFAEFAFAENLLTYKTTMGEDNEGNAYLFWKTEEEAAYVPALDQIRDSVVRAWKMIEARDLARKRADELAIQARVAKKPLKDVFANQSTLKVTDTNSFSWMTVGNVPLDPMSSQPRISQVEGVENAGPAFMEAVFSLSAGEIGVALNHPQDKAYVIRLVEYERPLDELRKDFAAEPPMRYMSIAGNDQRKVYLAWLDDLKKDARVHWIRQADAARRRAQSDMPIDMPESDGF